MSSSSFESFAFVLDSDTDASDELLLEHSGKPGPVIQDVGARREVVIVQGRQDQVHPGTAGQTVVIVVSPTDRTSGASPCELCRRNARRPKSEGASQGGHSRYGRQGDDWRTCGGERKTKSLN